MFKVKVKSDGKCAAGTLCLGLLSLRGGSILLQLSLLLRPPAAPSPSRLLAAASASACGLEGCWGKRWGEVSRAREVWYSNKSRA